MLNLRSKQFSTVSVLRRRSYPGPCRNADGNEFEGNVEEQKRDLDGQLTRDIGDPLVWEQYCDEIFNFNAFASLRRFIVPF